MNRTQIAPGVHLLYDPALKFNRCRISIHFAFPASRKTATAHALLPLVMERSYADCPDMTQLSKKLARLYGADLSVDARPLGCNRNLCGPFNVLGFAFKIAAISVWKLSVNCSSVKEAFPIGTWIMFVLSNLYSILPALIS